MYIYIYEDISITVISSDKLIIEFWTCFECLKEEKLFSKYEFKYLLTKYL